MKVRLNKKQRRVLIILGILVISSLFGGGLIVYQAQKPSDVPPVAALPTSTARLLPTRQDATETATLSPTPTETPGDLDTPEPTLTPTLTPTRQRSTICQGPPQMIVLALGIDRRQDSYDYGLADVIRVVRVDFISGDVTVLTLPRDLWVEIPGVEDRGITTGKLNQAYYYGSEYYGAYDNPDYGPGLMMDTLALNYDLSIDRYITVNMQSLEKMIDAVGGIDLTLPYNVDGKSTDPDDPFDLGYFPAGEHHFDGETAVRFARIRMMDNDYKRTTRQSMVLKALWQKVISPEILPKLPQMITILADSVQMNFQARDIRPLVCLAPLLDDDSLTFVNLPLEMLEEGRIYVDAYKNTTFIYRVDEAEFKALIHDFQRGSWPTPEP